MVITRQEKEKLILDLYNQGKTYKQIAEIARVSPRDIKPVLEKAEKEREKELGISTQEGNNGSTGNQNQTQKTSTFSQAYRLFSEGKNLLDVAIELNLREPQVTRHYREYCKLRGLYKLNLVYEEIKDGITDFLKLHRLSKTEGMSTEHVVNLLKIANNNLPALEDRYEKLQQNVDHLESRELDASITLEDLNSQIQGAKQRLDSYHLSCQKEVRKMLELHRQIMGLNSLLRQCKNNNEEYIKIRYVVKQTVRSTLSDKRQLLKLALLSLIESLRADPTKFNFLADGMPSPLTATGSTKIAPLGNNYHVKPFSYYSNPNYTETLTEVIVNETAVLYEKMVKDFANQTMTNAAAGNSANVTAFDDILR